MKPAAGKLASNLTQGCICIRVRNAGGGESKEIEKTVDSEVTLYFNDKGPIERHSEEWHHEADKSGKDGFLDGMQAARKKMDAKLIESPVTCDPAKVRRVLPVQ